MNHSTRGFTIVELLIVIVVIAILASITIVAYNGIQNSAHDASVQSDISNFAKKIEIERVQSADGQYPTSLTPAMGFAFAQGSYDTSGFNLYYCYNPTTNKLAFGVASKTGNSWSYTTDDGVRPYTGRIYGSNTCGLIDSSWGGAGIVNLNGYTTGGGWASWTN
ncbi:hypothetical protein CL689_00725 [Candidatus Saccharibacteria bacterium]|nr:hypothetical protein [Candidatus Saccharibacteria bacterium]MBQ68574.1 hypothetical protein [Candidatus Saccharibacteria bacterium]|tara:strand:+ start:81 stop:572 length:492 start_codon:yes stop_codon:yes gene_type:complete